MRKKLQTICSITVMLTYFGLIAFHIVTSYMFYQNDAFIGFVMFFMPVIAELLMVGVMLAQYGLAALVTPYTIALALMLAAAIACLKILED